MEGAVPLKEVGRCTLPEDFADTRPHKQVEIETVLRKLVALAMMSLFSSSLGAATKTIFILESYHDGYQWDHDYKAALVKRLGGKYRMTGFQMDTKRLPKNKHQEMADKAFSLIQQEKPALVVLGDDAALQLVGPRLDRLGIPGVYLGINNNPRAYGKFNHITGVLERPLMKRNIVLIRQMLPRIRKVLVLFDHDITSEVIRKEVFEGQDSYRLGQVQAEVKLYQTVAEWKQAVLNAERNGYDAVVAGLYLALHDNEGRYVDANQVITWTSAHTTLPLFCYWDWAVGADKAVGGLLINGTDQGNMAADIVLRILEHGIDPAAIYPVVGPIGVYEFSRTQLERFKLKLPAEIADQVRMVK